MQVIGAPQKYQDHLEDVRLLRRGPLEDEGITFRRRDSSARRQRAEAAA